MLALRRCSSLRRGKHRAGIVSRGERERMPSHRRSRRNRPSTEPTKRLDRPAGKTPTEISILKADRPRPPMPEVSKIAPADFESAPRVVSKIDSSDFEAKGDDPPPKSLMDPKPGTSTLKRVGQVIGRYDPSNPANMGRVAPLVAGAAPAMASMFLPPGTGVVPKIGTAFLGGLLSPYAEAATAKALGEPAEMPTLYSALKVAG